MLTTPQLRSVGRSERLNYKASMDGALLLKTGRFLKRYTGNTHVAVDINGKVWLNTAALKKAIGKGKEKPGKKKPAVETAGCVKVFTTLVEEQNSANLSTQPNGLLTDTHNLSTKQPKKYTVNKKEVPRRIMAMVNSRYGCRELYFVTVSFPPVVTDKLGVEILNHWLTLLRKRKMIRQYLWVAERQPQTNTIHFHICVCSYFPVQMANAMMKGVLRIYHKEGRINYPGSAKYNGVDIAGRRFNGPKSKKYVTNFVERKGGKALGWYLTKYVTKNNAEFENLAWHNSRGFSALFHGITLSYEEFEDVFGYVDQLNCTRVFENEWFAWAPWAGDTPLEIEQHLFDVNSYVQHLMGIEHPKDEGQLQYINQKQPYNEQGYFETIKTYAMRYSNDESNRESFQDAEIRVLTAERQKIKAFFAFCGEEDFTAEFCDSVRLLIFERVQQLEMKKEFYSLICLINQEREKEFSFVYYLYCYWAVDLLNQISNN